MLYIVEGIGVFAKNILLLTATSLFLSHPGFAKYNLGELKSCVETVCGASEKLPNVKAQLEAFGDSTNSFDSLINREILPLIEKVFNSDFEQDKIASNFFIQHAEDLLDLELSSTLSKFAHFIQAIYIQSSLQKYFTQTTEGVWELNKENPNGQNLPKNHVELTRLILNSKQFKDMQNTTSKDYWIFFAIEYPGLSFVDALRLDIMQVDKKIEELYTVVPALKVALGPSHAKFNRIKTNLEMDRSNYNSYFNFRYFVYLADMFFLDVKFAKFREGNLFVKEVIAREDLVNLNKLLTIRTNPQFVRSKIELTKDMCKTSLRKALSVIPSEAQTSQVLNSIDKLKLSAAELVQESFGIPRVKALNELNRIEFYFPDTQKRLLETTKKYFETLIAENEELMQKMQKYSLQNEWTLTTAIAGALVYRSENADASQSNIYNFCKSLSPEENPSDFSLTNKSKIKISWQSLFYSETGLGVVAHEIGHVVKDLVLKNLQESKNSSVAVNAWARTACISGFYNKLENGNKYLGEDFADAFAAKLLKSNAANYACMFLNTEGNDYNYQQIDVFNSSKEGSHSANLFRAIHWYSFTNSIPKSCEAIIQSDPRIGELKQCL